MQKISKKVDLLYKLATRCELVDWLLPFFFFFLSAHYGEARSKNNNWLKTGELPLRSETLEVIHGRGGSCMHVCRERPQNASMPMWRIARCSASCIFRAFVYIFSSLVPSGGSRRFLMGVLEGSLTNNRGAKECAEICVFVLQNTLLGTFYCYIIAISHQKTSNNVAE